MRPSLLPGNATPLERLAAEALAQIQRVPLPMRDLISPERCPAALLPYLAWAFSVDRWDSQWPEPAKRSAIRAAFLIHCHKGTIGALRRVVEPLGYLIDVREWFETTPLGVPGTFALEIGVLDGGISDDMYDELIWLIDDAKPLTRHLTGIAIILASDGCLRLAAGHFEGEEIDVYPPQARDIVVTGSIGLPGRTHTLETLDVYPHD